MPLRSPKMYFCIFGFHRLVWWPKCTPASSSSFIVNAAMTPPSVCLRRATGRAAPDRKRAACVMVNYVVYLPLIRTYSSPRSHVQTRSSPRPRPRSIVISYSPRPMISRTRSRRTPSRSMPPSTTRSPPKAMATLSCSTRAGDLPSAIMIRPQFGSAPLSAVLTSGAQRVAPARRPAHGDRDELRRALAVRDQRPREPLHQRLEAGGKLRKPPPPLEGSVLGEPVGEHGHRVARGLIGIHGDAVER